MRLYPTGNAPRTVIEHPKWGKYDADPRTGGFDLPDEMSDEMHSYCHRGARVWENEEERSLRLHSDDLARRRDPAALYDAAGDVTSLLKQLASVLGTQPETAARPARGRKAKAETGDGDDVE